MKKKEKLIKMTEREKELLKIVEIASNVVVLEDLELLKKLAKY